MNERDRYELVRAASKGFSMSNYKDPLDHERKQRLAMRLFHSALTSGAAMHYLVLGTWYL
jgi:hypothetical protein